MNNKSYNKLEKNLMLFYIGGTHSAENILKEQSNNMTISDKINAQKKMCDFARTLKEELQNNNVDAVGELLHENWILKKTLANNISDDRIDNIYAKALDSGAIGGKLLGAGGAGFMLFYVPEDKQENVKRELLELRNMDFEFDNSGVSIVMIDKDYS